MLKNIVAVRNRIFGFLYKNILKKILFLFDPETIHNLFLAVGRFLGSNPLTRWLTSFCFNYSDPKLEQEILGMKFKNPIGLAAGFDKNAVLVKVIPEVGFGFMEVGSITAKPYNGNVEPRLSRLPKSESLVVNYGLKNHGAKKISERLRGRKFKIPFGISVAKTNSKDTTETVAGIEDYAEGYKNFLDVGDYFTINISCPNSFGGEPFTEPEKLDRLLDKIDKIKNSKPLFIKLSPDLSNDDIDGLLAILEKHIVDGIICGNLTKQRLPDKIKDENVPQKGGLSGKIAQDLSDNLIRYIRKKTGNKYVIVGCGGVFTAEDAYKKIKAGASLIQLITGMIFEGPQVISEINRGLVNLLEKDGFKNISEAIGKDTN